MTPNLKNRIQTSSVSKGWVHTGFSRLNPDRNFYRLEELDGAQLSGTMAGNRLKKCHGRRSEERIGDAADDAVSSPRVDEEVEGLMRMTPRVKVRR